MHIVSISQIYDSSFEKIVFNNVDGIIRINSCVNSRSFYNWSYCNVNLGPSCPSCWAQTLTPGILPPPKVSAQKSG